MRSEILVSFSDGKRSQAQSSQKVFDGPVSESVPTSVASFNHRRLRADSTTGFTYFLEDDQVEGWADNDAVIDDDGGLHFNEPETDVGIEELLPSGRRRSSILSRSAMHDPLLDGGHLVRSQSADSGHDGRKVQKIYIHTEDLTIVIAGFSTSLFRALLYLILCTMTLGVAYLLCRWLPRWRVALSGTPTPLRDCTWVVIEVSRPPRGGPKDYSPLRHE